MNQGLQIDIYSHHFQVSNVTAYYNQTIENFASRLFKVETQRDSWGNVVTEEITAYATRSEVEDTYTYRFHVNLFDVFKDYMNSHGMELLHIKKHELYVPGEYKFTLKPGWVPFDNQIAVIDYLVSPGTKKVIDAATGSGKGLLHGTPVRGIDGWINVEDLVTDDLVMGETGAFHKVTGVYPQGDDLDLYEISFADGRKVITDAVHLWQIKKPRSTVNMSTKEILDFRSEFKGAGERMYIPLVDNLVSQPDIELPIDPYFLGVILGDGYIRDERVSICKPDADLHKRISDIAKENDWDYRVNEITRTANALDGGGDSKVITGTINAKSNDGNIKLFNTLKSLGLMNTRSETKFIPEIYKRASTNQRLELARGLLDTDGHTGKGSVEYGTVSVQLKEDMKELLYSLGCIVKVTVKTPMYRYRGEYREGKVYYRFNIRSRFPASLFTLPSKLAKANVKTQYSDGLSLRITGVRKLDYTGATTCISVDNPTKLFVTKDYLVTHNTVMTIMALAQINQRTALVVRAMYMERWLDVAAPGPKQALTFTKKDVMTVRGSSQLRSLILLAKDDELRAKFIIISNRTLAMYYEHYKDFGESEEYGFVKPEDLWMLLDVGVRLIDEAHEHFHSCFISDLNSHVPKSIELSGTLDPDDVFMKQMYHIMYPPELRMNTGKREKYIRLYALNYQLSDAPKPVRTTRRGRSSYSQAAYEENILKDKKRTKNFVNMIKDVVARGHMVEKLEGYKLLMFFDTVDACALIADTLAEVYPDLKVSKYTQEEKADVLDTCDIIVATPGSAGTAVDITNLQTVVSFVMRSSSQALIQYIGRLRKLKTDEVSPKYYYLYTRNISTHNKYHLKAQEVYKNIALSTESHILNHTI